MASHDTANSQAQETSLAHQLATQAPLNARESSVSNTGVTSRPDVGIVDAYALLRSAIEATDRSFTAPTVDFADQEFVAVLTKASVNEQSASTIERTPVEHLVTTSDNGEATVLLAASASVHASGIVLPVDGGWLGR